MFRQKNKWHYGMWAALAVSALVSANVYADGQADLRNALSRLQASSPVKGVVEAKIWSRQGEGKDADETQGNASISVEDSGRGLHILYSKDLLTRLDAEERAKEKDSKSKAPLANVVREFNSSDLRQMISAASVLSRRLEKANFKAEKQDSYNGKPARVLSFEIPIEKLNDKDRKYVKKYEGNLEVWIDSDGTPLASRFSETVSGRAYIVVSFEIKEDENLSYGVSGDRLVILKKERKNLSSGAGERSEIRTIKTLQLQS